ncbi:trypsin-like serine peptidase [Streptomyces sp. NPDC021093]|uniref:trypsin-like serine peptidase n=1 Tax=Streptomyces sp. NPDC021093 TaxID=3365112 RepID=UPI003793861C
MIPALSVTVAALAATLVPTAQTPTAQTPAPASSPAPIGEDAESVRAYWTADRMREAVAATGARDRAVRGQEVRGQDGVVPSDEPPGGVPWDGDPGDVAHVGRLFMVLPGGQKATCTAAVVTAANRDVVSTAGHCVHLKAVGGAMKSLLFVPGYDDGRTPYGSYPSRSVGVSPAWTEREDHAADFAFVTLGTDDRGRHVQDVVGSLRAAFHAKPSGVRTALGYPFLSPYDGKALQYCAGNATPVKDDRLAGGSQLRPCRMTNGASGGPWYAPTLRGGAVQVAVTSARPKEAGFKDAAWGAMFNGTAEALFKAQEALTSK